MVLRRNHRPPSKCEGLAEELGISEYRATKELPNVKKLAAAIQDSLKPTETIAEIEYGMESDGWGENRRAAMRRYLEDRFSPVYPDPAILRIWAGIMAGGENKGRRMSHSDAWIASASMRDFSKPALL